MRRIHWSELPRNKFVKDLEPQMLTYEGHIVLQFLRPIGVKRSESKEWHEVVYDKDYVAAKIAQELLMRLNVPSLSFLFGLISLSYRKVDEQLVPGSLSSFSIMEKKLLAMTGIYDLLDNNVIQLNEIVYYLKECNCDVIFEGKKL